MNFWLQFAISEAISLAESVVANSHINDALKSALVGFIEAGKAVVAASHPATGAAKV